MAITIKIKNSSTASLVPTFTTDINLGELAVNYTDQKLYSANATAVFELGLQGDAAGLPYAYSTTTTDADPG